jgi:hypothetical protein
MLFQFSEFNLNSQNILYLETYIVVLCIQNYKSKSNIFLKIYKNLNIASLEFVGRNALALKIVMTLVTEAAPVQPRS